MTGKAYSRERERERERDIEKERDREREREKEKINRLYKGEIWQFLAKCSMHKVQSVSYEKREIGPDWICRDSKSHATAIIKRWSSDDCSGMKL